MANETLSQRLRRYVAVVEGLVIRNPKKAAVAILVLAGYSAFKALVG